MSARRDAFLVADVDDAGFVERITGVDATLAPAGHALVQADMPLKPGECLTGDLVAAPGVRAEVSINSALHAARLATARAGVGVTIAG